MAKKIKLTAEQVKKIQDYKIKRVKLTESQLIKLNKYFESLKEDINYKPTPKISQPAEILKRNFKKGERDIPGFKAESVQMTSDYDLSKFIDYTLELLKQILIDPSQAGLSAFWVKNGISRTELFNLLSDIGIISYVDNKLVINKNNLKKKINRLYHAIKEKYDEVNEINEKIVSLGDDIELSEDSSETDKNQFKGKTKQVQKKDYNILFYDGQMAILKGRNNELYFFYYGDMDEKDFIDYANKPVIDTYKDEEGEISFVYGDWEIDGDVIEQYVNNNDLSIGTTIDDYEMSRTDLIKINPEIAAQILLTFYEDTKLLEILLSSYPEAGDIILNEIEVNLGAYKNKNRYLNIAKNVIKLKPELGKRHPELSKLIAQESSSKTESLVRENNFRRNVNKEGKTRKLTKIDAGYRASSDENKCNNCMHFRQKTNNCSVVRGIVDKEMICNYYEKKDNTSETTTAASSGAYVTPKVWAKSKKDWRFGNKPSYHPNGKLVKLENHSIILTKKQLKMVMENFTKTQWPNGEFVEFDDCVKLNNNKEAQNGGCSVGAVDNVVKTKKTKDSVISKKGIFNEEYMTEALKLQHDKANSQLVVVSDLQGKEASEETFRNKNVLRQNGFRWNGKAWVIPVDKMELAKRTLSLINKAEYLINTLEELEEYIENSESDNKSLIKSKLEQYIQDLANATDEKTLSAEIRRYLTFFSKFYNYSFYNRILIYIQKPNATHVASYKKWQEKHRQVKKGAKGITILAPIIPKSNDDEEGEKSDINSKNVTGFKAVKVFDISDTETIDSEGEIPETPQWWTDNTPSETAELLYDAVIGVANYMGINVTYGDSKDGEKGYSTGDHINISSDVAGVGRLATMIHELAHELMHWKKSSIFYVGDDNGQRISSELAELQAESVSYVVLKHYDLPVYHHATYLALWKANKEKIMQNLEIISKVSQFIIDKIDEYMSNQTKSENK